MCSTLYDIEYLRLVSLVTVLFFIFSTLTALK